MEKQRFDMLSDGQLDELLAQASPAKQTHGFEQRMLARLQQPAPQVAVNNIVPFPLRKRPSFGWLGVPLAASLLLGLWLGGSDTAANFLPISTETLAQNVSDIISPAAADDGYDLTEDSLT